MREKSTIGTSELRKDAWDKVAGKAEYVADIHAQNLKTGVILRSSRHHAVIKKLDITQASQYEGILAIITHDDIPGESIYGPIIPDRPALAQDKVRFFGEPIAVVVAENKAAAEKARDAIIIEYEELPAVFDPQSASKDESIKIHKDDNLVSHIEVSHGDIEGGFKNADVIIEQRFSVPRIYPGYIETEASLALWHESDDISVWVSSQKPFDDRSMISKVLGMPEEKIIVRSAVIGGAFGGKEDSNLAILAALAAMKTKSNVRIINTREESILAHPKRHPAVLYYKVGAQLDGTLTAMQSKIYMDTGAYASYGPAVAQILTETVTGPYRIPNIQADTYLYYTNSPISGAMRGFGSPQTNFAYESLMDMLAMKLEMDPGDLRKKNIWRAGDHAFTGVKINQAESISISLERALEEQGRLQKIPLTAGKISGVGIALGMQTMGLGRGVPDDSTNRLEWLPDGKVLLHLGAPDLGQGLITVSAQMTAEALGLDYDQIQVAGIDTSVTPNGGVTCASRMTYMVGNSVIIAAEQAIASLIQSAARILGIKENDLRYERGKIIMLDEHAASPIPVSEITSRLAEEELTISESATFSFPYGPETPDHLPIGMPHVLFCFGAQVARVEIDPELGTIEVKDIIAIHDLGRVINQAGAEGQIEGGVATGIGYALSEEVKLKSDQNWVSGLTEYLMPTSLDIPSNIKCILLEIPEESGPFGVKGIGEISLVPTAAAIANAVYNATGWRAKSLPIYPEDLALRQQ